MRGGQGADFSIGQLPRFFDQVVRATMQRMVVEERSEVAIEPVESSEPAIDLRAIMRGCVAT
jgi:hypothetical protein